MMKETKQGTYIYGEDNYAFEFVTDLSASEKLIFVRTVVDSIVDNSNYDSVLRDIIFDYTTISMFTDVDTSFLKAVDEDGNVTTDIDLLENFLLETNIVDIVKANAFPTLFDELNNAVDKSIEYKTGIHINPLNEALSSLLSTLERKLDSFDMGSAMEMASKFSGMTEDFTIDNLVNAYMNSDMHKKNLDEIAESKKNEIKIDENLGEAIRTVIEENKAEKAENDNKN